MWYSNIIECIGQLLVIFSTDLSYYVKRVKHCTAMHQADILIQTLYTLSITTVHEMEKLFGLTQYSLQQRFNLLSLVLMTLLMASLYPQASVSSIIKFTVMLFAKKAKLQKYPYQNITIAQWQLFEMILNASECS